MARRKLQMPPVEHLEGFGFFSRDRVQLGEVAGQTVALDEDGPPVRVEDAHLGLEDPSLIFSSLDRLLLIYQENRYDPAVRPLPDEALELDEWLVLAGRNRAKRPVFQGNGLRVAG